MVKIKAIKKGSIVVDFEVEVRPPLSPLLSCSLLAAPAGDGMRLDQAIGVVRAPPPSPSLPLPSPRPLQRAPTAAVAAGAGDGVSRGSGGIHLCRLLL